MWTKPFAALSKNDAEIAGGKGASLGEMTQAGIPVPPGFVVLADAFREHVRANDLSKKIDTLLEPVDPNNPGSIDVASGAIQALILDNTRPMPKTIAEEIVAAHAALSADFVAVRSSATVEDGPDAAWAGQLDTYLNTTRDEVLTNVRRCWASLFTPRAIFYRFEKNLRGADISVSVVVQKMIQSEASGVAFSVDPVTENRNHMLIEGAFGLGEAVVGGHVTPDAYLVSKDPRAILEKTVTPQEHGLFKKETGSNEWRDIPAEKREMQKISDEHIARLADIIEIIEKHYDHPQDIEWALEHNNFYILQSRPITTLVR